MALNFETKLNNYHKAGYPMLYVQTHEENRVSKDIVKVFSEDSKNNKIYEWDEMRGLQLYQADGQRRPVKDTTKPQELIEFLDKYKDDKTIFILKDFHFYMPASKVIRCFRNMLYTLKGKRNMIIFVSPVVTIPTELEKEIQTLDYALPDEDAIRERLNFVRDSVGKNSKKDLTISEDIMQAAVEAAKGMTFAEIESAYSVSIVTNQAFNQGFVGTVFDEKIQQVKRQSLMSYLPPDIGFAGVGGLDELKEWIQIRTRAFSAEARKYGLPYPKGVLLCGMPGCGKTLIAKATSKEFNMPLFQLDIGKLFGSKVGEI